MKNMATYEILYASNVNVGGKVYTSISLNADDRFIPFEKAIASINGKEYQFSPFMDAPMICIKERLDPKELIGSEIAID